MAEPIAILRKKRSNRIERGHPWVYSNEIESISGDPQPGDVVAVIDHRGQWVGRGGFNPQSLITIRLFTRQLEEIVDAKFFHKRIAASWAYRQKIGYTQNARIVYGEADGLPGLVVDKFGDVLVLQSIALAVDRWKPEILAALTEILKPTAIYERNDVPVRQLEGLDQKTGFLYGKCETKFAIDEGDVKLWIDIENGQKTGFFLDQKEARRALKGLVSGANVLDAFCCTGGFSLHAAAYGAKSVLGLDASEEALALAKQSVELNGFGDRCQFECGNAFDILSDFAKAKDKNFDVIILDPPAFTKSRATLENAMRGYKEINLRALQILKPGGILITCSCSQFFTQELFQDVLLSAAFDAKRTVRQIGYLTQARDHPILLQAEETSYLKAFVLHVA